MKGVVWLRRFGSNQPGDSTRERSDRLGSSGWFAAKRRAGIKIAILDTGIEQTHPAFQDDSLPMPAGYPLCSGGDWPSQRTR